MNEGMREDAILWEVEPDRGLFGGRGSLTVMPFEIGVVIRDGEVVDVFESGKRNLPRKGEVRTYVASAKPFDLKFDLKDPFGAGHRGTDLDQFVLTRDREVVTGSVDLRLRVVPKNVEHLLKLLGPGSGGVTQGDVSDVIKGELQAKVLDLDIHQHTAEELRGNRELFRRMYESVEIEMSSSIRFFGLRLDNFYPNWGLTHEEREGIRERRHEEELREIRRQQEIEDLANRERERRQEEELAEIERERERERRQEEELRERERRQEIEDLANRERERRQEEELAEIRRQQEIEDLANRERERRQEEELAEMERERERERRHEEELREIKRRRDLLGKQDGGWIEIGYSFKNGRKSMEDVPGWVKEQIPKYNRMFHTTDRDSGSMSYHFDGGAFTYRISFARVYGGADVRVSRMLMESSSGGNFSSAGNYPAPEVSRPGVRPQRPGGYWVYEDRPTSRARVHEGTCRYCNHGDGMGKGRIEAENEWYGPFVSREDAFRRAGATGQRDVRGCGVCRP